MEHLAGGRGQLQGESETDGGEGSRAFGPSSHPSQAESTAELK